MEIPPASKPIPVSNMDQSRRRPALLSGPNTADVGIIKETIVTSFALHATLDVAAFIVSRATDHAEIKDWCWPSSQVLNAWWSALGRKLTSSAGGGLTLRAAWTSIPWTEKVLLACVTAWGTRLFGRIASRTLARPRGSDDPRYERAKADAGHPDAFWTAALLRQYLPEAAVLTLIALPFTLPFRLQGASSLHVGPEAVCALRALGVALFGTGFALEALADWQLEVHQRERSDLCRHGVWSIVRHPNYLGDALVHVSFVVLNAANSFHPVVLLGPLANYVFLRFVGGDKENEASQEARYKSQDRGKYEQLEEWRREKNSFWPSVRELANPWTWAVVGCGLTIAVAEEVIRRWLQR